MSSDNQHSCKINPSNYPNLADYKIGIVVSEWNIDITKNLLNGAESKLIELGVDEKNIITYWVPGSFELVFGCNKMSKKNYDAIIAIGCVIKGETDHYDYICSSVSNGISQLNVNGSTPVIFCVLTDHNKDQSIARSGGKQGNKGTESAIAAIKMAALK
ncbi:MAG: 6,7-dimethyl-8-ribityllumazine synthase [Flavobacteriaceae bacterium]